MDLKFVFEFMKRPREIGAIAPSSNSLSQRMTPLELIEKASMIVELGAGRGAFTHEILRKKARRCTVVIFETNDVFYNELYEKYKGRLDVILLRESAESLADALITQGIEHADLIISGLPFMNFPQQKTEHILDEIDKALQAEGRFLTFQYSKYKKRMFEKHFDEIKLDRVWRNLPPAYVFSCKKRKGSLDEGRNDDSRSG